MSERPQNLSNTCPEDTRLGTSSPSPLTELLQELNRLRARAHRMSRAQFIASVRLRRAHLGIGIPTIVLSTVVGTALFSTFKDSASQSVVFAAACVASVTAVLSALQTFLRFSDRSSQHSRYWAVFGEIKRELDGLALKIKCNLYGTPNLVVEQLDRLSTRFSTAIAECPPVRDRDYDRARAEQISDTEGI
ncbi:MULTISPECIES: SLATT domain-containing protein [Mycolicibacterium]|uniref:SLATT domain-containing protein n=1 Tax=Mycolicibacterium TaxID=1866885 RepID=UPI000D6B6600